MGERTTVVEGQRKFADLPDMKQVDAVTYAAIESISWLDYIASIDEEDWQKDGFYEIKDIVYKLDSGTASLVSNGITSSWKERAANMRI